MKKKTYNFFCQNRCLHTCPARAHSDPLFNHFGLIVENISQLILHSLKATTTMRTIHVHNCICSNSNAKRSQTSLALLMEQCCFCYIVCMLCVRVRGIFLLFLSISTKTNVTRFEWVWSLFRRDGVDTTANHQVYDMR